MRAPDTRHGAAPKEDLDRRLRGILGDRLPADAATHINAALELADLLEAEGYGFTLIDVHPRDPDESLWRATFARDGAEHRAEHAEAARAVCLAALRALLAAAPT